MVPGAVHRSPGIYLMAEENPGKSHLEERLIKAVRPVIVSNGSLTFKLGPYDCTARQERRNERDLIIYLNEF